ncbi:Pkinase-domain-containing protein [Cryphonectria parasitica EP155]|uniref:Pkinase-domain-containing protein n=1 Tax=Cryphonectria parasitica (strain ATCC 38755 / EP155) TaxID=660469 RepID=A0A9P4XWX5_CRYP1|nr:Pkinase-domain-containing protein [Cryphonectria parasitica EP155]KAF3762523.1 Pkinase-domain-containing protein [Cryphonectria parasitica EP155]
MATTVVRGFQTPSGSGDEESEYGGGTPRLIAADKSSPPILRGRRSRNPVIDDVVSVNCSPVLRPAPQSPAVSGISLLRSQIDSLHLDSTSSSRASSVTRCNSLSPLARPVRARGALNGVGTRPQSSYGSEGSGDEGASDVSTRYEITLDNDFVSASAPGLGAALGEDVFEDEMEGVPANPPRKMTTEDFEPLRCLGKGTYGTVILVKQRTTGRLYAQKQFKKASLVVHKKLIEQTKNERHILESVNRHPFVVKLYYAFQDKEKLYLILEYGQGGELFHHLKAERMFSETRAAFYLAEMVLALSHLHDDLGVVYRDLKPENILLDAEGHVLLTDFGLSKVAADDATCSSILGTVEYMAPEVIKGEKYGKAVDWWSLGALAYDMMVGDAPFRGGNHHKVQQNILKQKLALPYFLSNDAKDLVTRLLKKDPKKRLGSHMPKDLAIIKGHRFFRHIDWKKLAAREVEPPIQPMITDPELAENFSEEFTGLSLSPRNSFAEPFSPASARMDDNPFGGFSFVASHSLLNSNGFAFAQGA